MKTYILFLLIIILYFYVQPVYEGLEDGAKKVGCKWGQCCEKIVKPKTKFDPMRPHSHKMNPKVGLLFDDINSLMGQWFEKMKPAVPKEIIADDTFIEEENTKIDAILAKMKDDEIKKVMKKKPKKKGFPVDIDVVLDDNKDLKAFQNNIFKANNLENLKETFISRRHRALAWGFGPKTVNKYEVVY